MLFHWSTGVFVTIVLMVWGWAVYHWWSSFSFWAGFFCAGGLVVFLLMVAFAVLIYNLGRRE